MKYSLLDNWKYMVKMCSRSTPNFLLKVIICLIIGVAIPLINAMLPSLIVGSVERAVSWWELLMIVAFVFTTYAIMQFLYRWIRETNDMSVFVAKFVNMQPMITKKVFMMDYQQFESKQTRIDFQKANKAVISGDQEGFSGFAFNSVRFLESLLGLVVYMLFIGSFNIYILGLLMGISITRYMVFQFAKRYEVNRRDALAQKGTIGYYFRQQSKDVQSGKDIRLFQLQNWLETFQLNGYLAYAKEHMKIRFYYFLNSGAGLFLDVLRDGVCYGYVLSMVFNGVSVASVIFYINMIKGFGTWTTELTDTFSQITRCQIEVNDFRTFMEKDEKTIIHEIDNHRLNIPWEIKIEDLVFQYENENTPTINHLNLTIRPNEKLAIIGLNGAGKTTLIKLICGLYHPTSGKIYINGIDIETIDRNILHRYVSAIFQDNLLLAHTIKENIILSTTCDESKYKDVLKLSGMDEVLNQFKDNDQTYLYKDIHTEGIQLSGGQIQKLLLARALYKESQLLILDEPTAALDALAESEVYNKYHQMSQNKTSIFISHRLASTQFCDRIVYFENGQIMEEGTHLELMELQGKYASLYQVQSQYYEGSGEVC